MPKVTRDTVEHVAQLARLQLTEREKDVFSKQLGEVLAYAESIQAIDVTGVPPMSHAGTETPLREDRVQAGLPRETALSAAPDPAEGLFRVPRVMGS